MQRCGIISHGITILAYSVIFSVSVPSICPISADFNGGRNPNFLSDNGFENNVLLKTPLDILSPRIISGQHPDVEKVSEISCRRKMPQ